MKYYPDLTTLNNVRKHRKLGTTETGNDALLIQFIHETSAEVGEFLNRVCMPYVDTIAYDFVAGNIWNSRQLHTRDDLLAITTLTNGDDSTITSGNYVLRPSSTYPKRDVHLTAASGLYFTYVTDWLDAISIAGTWGYVPHYATSAWQDSTINIPAGNLTSSATTVTVSDGTAFEALQYIRVNSEVMQITAISTNVLTITRGELGTTAAAHSEGDDIEQFHQLPDIAGAVVEIVSYRYLNKDEIGRRVKIFDGGMVVAEDLDPMVMKALTRHRKHIMADA